MIIFFPYDSKSNGLKFQPIQTVHVMNGYYIVPSFGLMISYKQHKIFITGDTQFCPEQIKHFYNEASMIIHDCEIYYGEDKTPYRSTVHSHYEDLKTLPKNIKNKMWLCHYQDTFPKDNCWIKDDEFNAFIHKGTIFTFKENKMTFDFKV
jgi:ribonuclease BN (tRNA processing enzyme)